jgi:inosose dehydratase
MTSPDAIELAGGPVSWGVDFAGDPANPPYDAVLAGIAAAGLRWAELGPVGYLPPRPAVLDAHGLRSAGGFVFEALHDPLARTPAIEAARSALAAIAATGGRFLVVIDRPGEARAATAGRSAAAPRLDAARWRRLAAAVREIAELAADRGVRAVFHPHAGSYVEFEDEIERLLADVPADALGLCLDTGHALYAGADPVALVARYGGRLEHLHLKDVSPPRLAAARAGRLDFWTAITHGIFCPVGEGALDLDALRAGLSAAAYTGLATVEQDRRPGSPGVPEDDLRRSVERLRAAGIGTGSGAGARAQ